MARPPIHNSDARLGKRITVRFNGPDIARLHQLAAKADLTPSEYVRLQSLRGKLVINQTRQADPALIAELNRLGVKVDRVGVNVNQIAHKANATGRFDAAEIDPALRDIEALRQQVEAVLLKAMAMFEP